jgi:hypothetical protein
LRTGAWFYAAALSVTFLIGVLAAFVIGDAAAATEPSTPKDMGRGPRPPRGSIHRGLRLWTERRARIIAAVLLVLLAASLLSHGIAGVTS